MGKYYITCDLEKTVEMMNFGVDSNKLDLQSLRSNVNDIINAVFNAKVTELVKYNDIKNFFKCKNKSDEFIIGLENGIYINNADFNFDSTRMYKSQGDILENSTNYEILQRDGSPLEEQMPILKQRFEESRKKKTVICDDGIFSGDTLTKTIENFKRMGIMVDAIRVVLNFSKNNNLSGIPIESMCSPQEYIDWIDERDFFYGTPMSGASVKNGRIFGIPYVANVKIASKKASIPTETSKEFCKNMIGENQFLWHEINKERNQETKLGEMPRISNLLEFYNSNQDIISVLNKEKDKI